MYVLAYSHAILQSSGVVQVIDSNQHNVLAGAEQESDKICSTPHTVLL